MVVTVPDLTYFLAGDVSYTQALMLAEKVDGVTLDRVAARQTLERVHAVCRATPTVYLPSHDPETPDRLAHRQPAVAQSTPALSSHGEPKRWLDIDRYAGVSRR